MDRKIVVYVVILFLISLLIVIFWLRGNTPALSPNEEKDATPNSALSNDVHDNNQIMDKPAETPSDWSVVDSAGLSGVTFAYPNFGLENEYRVDVINENYRIVRTITELVHYPKQSVEQTSVGIRDNISNLTFDEWLAERVPNAQKLIADNILEPVSTENGISGYILGNKPLPSYALETEPITSVVFLTDEQNTVFISIGPSHENQWSIFTGREPTARTNLMMSMVNTISVNSN